MVDLMMTPLEYALVMHESREREFVEVAQL
jgi:hypothetical protein